MNSLRAFLICPGKSIVALDTLPAEIPESGFVWLAIARSGFAQDVGHVQNWLIQQTGMPLLDLHVSDLLNAQLRSHFDYTSVYDMLVIRRLTDGDARSSSPEATAPTHGKEDSKNVVPAARKAQTVPVGFVVFDKVLLSVHPDNCSIQAAYVQRLKQLAGAMSDRAMTANTGGAVGGARLPDTPAELMLRVVSLMIDGYLDLRKVMTRQLDHWQQRLLRPNVRFDNWEALLAARQALHHIYDICDDQRNALDRWMDVLEDQPAPQSPAEQHERDQLLVRSRDVLEHIERVSQHVHQLERSAETAVQIHFNIQSNRTNDVMRTLTAVTAVFLPLNLIAGIFGMNFEYIPWLHAAGGFWWALSSMVFIAAVLFVYLARKRYLSSRELD
ncbi:magnesium transporter CorA family protein [Pollutimonas harenae]|uniref:Magnesium transporter CorA family protein n=1 Tax=Pollutimonas harenae TaxID=657015 RepID=A0A853H1Y2_9BURK|nr:magnesium transporter CorA family protein [Pollutimonas harenae]NYT84583.1 magnesium transporter CorA family protein [Pollutimonas harenae]TEA73025.1 magnesium transporter CorA [Pollutimonas harenae]